MEWDAGDAGSISLFGLELDKDEVAIKRRVGYVSPDMDLSPWGHVGQLLDFLRPHYPTWDAAYSSELIKRFGIRSDESIATLSLGNRTRLNLVAALSHRPDLLVLDEPTTGLDAIGKSQFFREIMSLMEEERRAVLISSHNLADIERFADRVGFMNRGRIVLEAPTSDAIERFCLVDAVIPADRPLKLIEGVQVVERDGQRWRLLVDSELCDAEALAQLEILSRTALSLEELFVLLFEERQSAELAR